MARRFLEKLPRRVLQVVLGVALLCAVVFFGLTRTDVGRGQLRRQIEQQFDERFAGQLQIGELTGNLVGTVYATDVRLRGPDGRVVLTVDSVRALPRWRALLNRRVSFRSVELMRPDVQLVRGSEGRWNIAEAFQRETPVDSSGPPFALSFPNVTLRDGRVTTENRGALPAPVRKGRIFDYTDALLTDLDAQLTLERPPGQPAQVDLSALSGRLPEQRVTLREASGQVAAGAGRLAVNGLHLRLDRTRLRGTFTMNESDDGSAPTLRLHLAESRLDHDELRRLVPRWPLTGATTVAADVHGPLDRLRLGRLLVKRGASRLRAEGTLRGLPRDLTFDLHAKGNTLAAADLEAVLPGLPAIQRARLARLGTVHFSLDTQGRLRDLAGGIPRLQAQAQVETRSDAGALRGTAEVTRRPSRPLSYDASLHAEDFDASQLTENRALPDRINGAFEVSGSGAAARAPAGELRVRLDSSLVAGHYVEHLQTDLHAEGDRLSGTATLRQDGGGTLRAEGTVNLTDARPAYQINAEGRRFDLGALLDADSLSTALNGTARIDGRGVSLGALSGTLAVSLDSSTVARGNGPAQTLPPLASALHLAGPATADDEPRVRLTGDLADLTVTGEANPAALRSLGRLWGPALAEAARNAYDKPYDDRAAVPQSAARRPAPLPMPEARHAARQALRTARLGNALALQAHVTLKRPALLRALVPALPAVRDPLSLDLDLKAGAEAFSARGAVTAEHLRVGRARADSLTGRFRLRAQLGAPLAETLTASFDAGADTLALGPARFRSPTLSMSYHERAADFQLSTQAVGRSERLQLEAGLHLLPDRNRLRVRTLRLDTGPYQWRTTEPQRVDLYAHAVRVPGLELVSTAVGGRQQALRLHGTLSSAARDTVFAEADDLLLRSLSEAASMKRPLGGLLNAQVALTGGLRSPKLTGRLDVARLSFDDRLLGRLTARSRYVPGRPDVALHLGLRPPTRSRPLRPGAPALTPEDNRLSAAGTFALPGLGDAGAGGALDLKLDVDRADLFFFNYIFDDKIDGAEGALAGTARIRGSFRKPLFDADFQVADAHFLVPRFGLEYRADGNVTIDREGIHINGGRLTDTDDGTAIVNGSLLFNDYDHFSFDLDASLDELQIMDVASSKELPFYGDIAASGPLRLEGPLSSARLVSEDARTTPDSELLLPIAEGTETRSETGFLIFADSTGHLPDLKRATQRRNLLSDRPTGEQSFVDGLEMDLNINAPPGSTVRLVFDPLLGDEVTARGSGRIQLQRQDGLVSLFGNFEVESGSYLFTAGEVFQRRFQLEGGTIGWDGPPVNASLDLTATYRTRASCAGLPGANRKSSGRIPLVVRLGISGRVAQPKVDLSLDVDPSSRGFSDYSATALETILNREDRESEYATSVLLTNTFLLTTDLPGRQQQGFGETSNRLAFNSVSQLVSSQLNRYLNAALPNLDVNLGVQGEDPQNLDVIYGVALRLLDERLIIRGEGVLDDQNENTGRSGLENFEGEFTVEVRLTSRVSAEAFYRREGSLLSDQALTRTTGAGLSYQTEFSTWDRLWHKLFGWLGVGEDPPEKPTPERETVAAEE